MSTGPTILVYHAQDADRYAKLIRVPRIRSAHVVPTVRVAATPAEAGRAIADADILYAWDVPRDLLLSARRLRWLQAMGAGVNWALVPELSLDVTLTRAPGVFGPWMAEYVLGWCLWTTQRIEQYLDAQRRRQWIEDVLPDRLRGKTLAIVGLGDIGRAIARAARSLGMRVIGVSRSGRRAREADRVYRASGLTRALAAADVVVLTVPLTPATRGLIGSRAFTAMRPTTWLINVARGPVIDERALLHALENRRIAGAVLDVFWKEPLPADHPLWAFDNVIFTPHIAGPSTPEEIAPIFNDNLARFLAGRRLRHVVDRSRGY